MPTDDHADPRVADARLAAVYERYLASVSTGGPTDRSRARLDLGLMLEALGEEMPPLVLAQLQRDGAALLREVPALPEH